jgi:hypothetical protein
MKIAGDFRPINSSWKELFDKDRQASGWITNKRKFIGPTMVFQGIK